MIRTSGRIRGRIANSPLVKEKDPRTWRHLGVLLVLVLVLALPILLGVAWQAEYVRAQYAIKDLGAHRQKLDDQLLQLTIERASIEALDLVSKRARRELTLVPGDGGLRVFVIEPAGAPSSGIASAAPARTGNSDVSRAPGAPADPGRNPDAVVTQAFEAGQPTVISDTAVAASEDAPGRGGVDGL